MPWCDGGMAAPACMAVAKRVLVAAVTKQEREEGELEELKQDIKEVFDMFDVDGSGKIDGRDLKAATWGPRRVCGRTLPPHTPLGG